MSGNIQFYARSTPPNTGFQAAPPVAALPVAAPPVGNLWKDLAFQITILGVTALMVYGVDYARVTLGSSPDSVPKNILFPCYYGCYQG